MKFRRLSNEELAELEKEFVRFLASNSVTGDDWVKIKAEQPQKAEQLIELFSDIVIEKTLSRIQYLEYKAPKDVKTFFCEKEKITMIGMQIKGESELDFTKGSKGEEMIEALKNSNAQVQLYQAEKGYKPDRPTELFRMMESGCLISDGSLFKMLSAMKPNNKGEK